MRREEFRNRVFRRDGFECLVPWCDEDAKDAHHIIERAEWDNGGYFPDNGASVCHKHHKAAEDNYIPPQAFWQWIDVVGPTPDGMSRDVDKWGEPLDTPPWEELRDFHKYPSSRHLPFSHVGDKDDTAHRQVDCFIDTPLVITEKVDGSNAMLVKDAEEPVRSRRGRKATHDSFDQLHKIYWERGVYEELPSWLQVFGEWAYAKHSIHYGCDGCCDERNQGEPLPDHFLVFGVFDTRYNMWLSWDETEMWAEKLGFQTTPHIKETQYNNQNELYSDLTTIAGCMTPEKEGFVVRSRYPFHYGQFPQRLGKYVREDHVTTDEHWSHQQITENKTQ